MKKKKQIRKYYKLNYYFNNESLIEKKIYTFDSKCLTGTRIPHSESLDKHGFFMKFIIHDLVVTLALLDQLELELFIQSFNLVSNADGFKTISSDL